jgi:hypothetical protein
MSFAVAAIAALPGLCREVVAAGRHVSVDAAAVERFAGGLSMAQIESLGFPPLSAAEAAAPPAERAALLMAQMAVNFCYFPEQGCERWWVLGPEGEEVGKDDEANAMTAALLGAWQQQLLAGSGFASGEYLAALSDVLAAEVTSASTPITHTAPLTHPHNP